MQKEIYEQSASVVNTMRGRVLNNGQVVLGGIKVSSIEILLIAYSAPLRFEPIKLKKKNITRSLSLHAKRCARRLKHEWCDEKKALRAEMRSKTDRCKHFPAHLNLRC